MTKAYWINTFRSVRDPERLAAYVALAGPVMRSSGGRFLVRGQPARAFEAGLMERTVVIEFDSVDTAVATYESPGYQAALAALGDGAERDIRIVEANVDVTTDRALRDKTTPVTTAPTSEAMPRAGDAPGDADEAPPLAWSEVAVRLRSGGWFWLSTVQPDGSPHLMPVIAAWSDAVLYVASKDTARKSRNLVAESRCVLATDSGDLHIVIEGRARRRRDTAGMRAASAAFDAVYHWPTDPSGDELDAPYGAPTSGGPPYAVFEITPTKAFAFPVDGESCTPTRWRFGP